jgi:hypothetical protein
MRKGLAVILLPVRIQAMSLMCSGGPAWFDHIRLSQTPELPAKP